MINAVFLVNVILYITIFIMGTFFGSFYTLAVYRIPRKIDIIKTHSFCPNCNHKLGALELIPVWSYIFLGGKCKSCKQKIRPRYFILEVLSGLAFVLIALSFKINIYTLNVNLLIDLAFIILYLVAIFLIAGIDKESRKIEKSVLYYALGILVIYIIYLCIIDNTSIYRYVIYVTTLLLLVIIDTIKIRKYSKNSYLMSILILLVLMSVFTSEIVTLITIISTFVIMGIIAINLKRKKEDTKILEKMHIGFYLGVCNVITFIVMTFMRNWI